MIILWSVNEADDITIITNSSTISKVGQDRTVFGSIFVFCIPIQLRKQHYRNIKLFCQGF